MVEGNSRDLVTAEIRAQFEDPNEVVMHQERCQKLRAIGAREGAYDEDRIYI